MARMISRKPFVGIAAGLLFGALGILLLGIKGSRGAAMVLFPLSAWSFLLIGAVSFLTGARALVRSRHRKKQ
jgi:hypothetical protein